MLCGMDGLTMPNRKPQVMWMAKDSDELTLWIQFTREAVVMDLENNMGSSWQELKVAGWRIVEVEVRETKKGK